MTDRADELRLSPSQREHVAALADLLIPGQGEMPSASAADVATTWVDAALAHRPDLYAPLQRVLTAAAAAHDDEVFLIQLSVEAVALFDDLTTLIAGAYLMNPVVREALGYRQDLRHYVDDLGSYTEMLERVVERGQTFRATGPLSPA